MPSIRTALVVDDDEDLLRLCQVSLRTSTDWSVDVARSVATAIDAAGRRLPDVILLDLTLDGPDGGLAFLRTLRDARATAGVPVILLTAAVGAIDVCRREGAAGFIAKPFDPVTLRDRIVRIVDDRGALRSDAHALAALRTAYTRSVPGRLRRLSRAIDAARENPRDRALQGRAEAVAHRLRGTTGSYGLARVSDALAIVEDALRRARDADEEAALSSSAIEAALRDADAGAADAIRRLGGSARPE
jgi:DNA-binding response OmpR family regulator